ncbi:MULTISPECIES: hypothetical protein [Psychromonas]|uniref:hypothetical protein n=1 Tax=Psychromonas TaxID=67572 RepID=UPI0003675D6D|nr:MULTISPECIES: hypothetical protein [Psychromonas]
MDMSVVGGVMTQQAKISTLEKVNVSLLKTANKQAEEQTVKLLESVKPAPVGNLGKHIDIEV